MPPASGRSIWRRSAGRLLRLAGRDRAQPVTMVGMTAAVRREYSKLGRLLLSTWPPAYPERLTVRTTERSAPRHVGRDDHLAEVPARRPVVVERLRVGVGAVHLEIPQWVAAGGGLVTDHRVVPGKILQGDIV